MKNIKYRYLIRRPAKPTLINNTSKDSIIKVNPHVKKFIPINKIIKSPSIKIKPPLPLPPQVNKLSISSNISNISNTSNTDDNIDDTIILNKCEEILKVYTDITKISKEDFLLDMVHARNHHYKLYNSDENKNIDTYYTIKGYEKIVSDLKKTLIDQRSTLIGSERLKQDKFLKSIEKMDDNVYKQKIDLTLTKKEVERLKKNKEFYDLGENIRNIGKIECSTKYRYKGALEDNIRKPSDDIKPSSRLIKFENVIKPATIPNNIYNEICNKFTNSNINNNNMSDDDFYYMYQQ